MRTYFFILFLGLSFSGLAQEERDTVLKRCPVFITDTTTSNNFFIEARPCTLKVYRVRGDLAVVVEQKDQFLSIFFPDKKLKNGKYKILARPRGNSELAAKYSFRSGDQVSYVDVSSGTVDVNFDKEKGLWMIRVNGLIANLVERNITYYRVRTNLAIR